MKRWHEDYPRTHREWRKHYLSHVESNKGWPREVGKDPYEVDCVCDQQKGRFRKTDAWDCGKNWDKFPSGTGRDRSWSPT